MALSEDTPYTIRVKIPALGEKEKVAHGFSKMGILTKAHSGFRTLFYPLFATKHPHALFNITLPSHLCLGGSPNRVLQLKN